MPRVRSNYAGTCRGEVTQRGHCQADIELTDGQALRLIAHLAECMTCGRGARIEAHWGRRGAEGHLIRVATP